MSAPKRIQRKRTKGWRMPEGAIYVGRPSIWNNPYRVVQAGRFDDMSPAWAGRHDWEVNYPRFRSKAEATAHAVKKFREHVLEHNLRDRLHELRGKDLVCWCPEGQPCHADVLIELANAPTGQNKEEV